jgi:hypothetical protein
MSDFMQYLQGNQDRAAERAQEQYLSSLGRKIIAEVGSPATARLFSILEQKRSEWLANRNYTEHKLGEIKKIFDVYQPSIIQLTKNSANGLVSTAQDYLENYRIWLGTAEKDLEKHNNYLAATKGARKETVDNQLIGKMTEKEKSELNNIKKFIGYK